MTYFITVQRERKFKAMRLSENAMLNNQRCKIQTSDLKFRINNRYRYTLRNPGNDLTGSGTRSTQLRQENLVPVSVINLTTPNAPTSVNPKKQEFGDERMHTP